MWRRQKPGSDIWVGRWALSLSSVFAKSVLVTPDFPGQVRQFSRCCATLPGFSLALHSFCGKYRPMNQMIRWSVFRGDAGVTVVPQMPLLVRLRQMTPDTFFAQDALQPLKSMMEMNFILGPSCIIAALYLPSVSLILVVIGILSLALSSLYWFASHWLCSTYLRQKGYSVQPPVDALDLEAARNAAS